jgi:hypothetical protein
VCNQTFAHDLLLKAHSRPHEHAHSNSQLCIISSRTACHDLQLVEIAHLVERRGALAKVCLSRLKVIVHDMGNGYIRDISSGSVLPRCSIRGYTQLMASWTVTVVSLCWIVPLGGTHSGQTRREH